MIEPQAWTVVGHTYQSVPHNCPKCIAEGTYYGILVFGDEEPPFCPVHKKTRLIPSSPSQEKS